MSPVSILPYHPMPNVVCQSGGGGSVDVADSNPGFWRAWGQDGGGGVGGGVEGCQ